MIKASAAGGPKTIEIDAYNGGILHVGGFALPVVVDLTGLRVDQVNPVLIDHEDDSESVLGQTDSVLVDGATIKATGKALGVSDKAANVIAMADGGYQWQASIGCVVEAKETIAAGQKVQVNGQTFSGPIIVARQARLREISFVATGAGEQTSARIAAGLGQGTTVMTFEEWLASLGLDPTTLNDAQKTALQTTYATVMAAQAAASAPPAAPPAATPPASPPVQAAADTGATPPAAPPEDPEKKMEARLLKVSADTLLHVAKIKGLCGGDEVLTAKALNDKWSAERTELEVLKAKRPSGQVITVNNLGDSSPEVLTAALCMSSGLKAADKAFDNKTILQAKAQYTGKFGLQRLLLLCAARAGLRASPHDFNSQHHQILKAAFSSADVAGILSNTANKFLLEGWNSVEDTWRKLAAIRNVGDFKTSTSYRLTSAGTWERVGTSGTLADGSLGEQSYTNRAYTYGEIISITREMQINDDLDALSKVPKMLGRKAALTVNKAFWEAWFAAQASLWPSTNANANYFEGATTASVLSSTTLSIALTKFRKQTDSEGNPLGIDPVYLLVPPELEAIAQEIYASLNINTGGSSTSDKVPNKNVHAGKYEPIVSSYLSNSGYTGYSATAWWLMADPMDLAAIEVAFLDGQESPTIQNAETDFRTLGMQMRGFIDFGVAAQEYRAGVKSKGAA